MSTNVTLRTAAGGAGPKAAGTSAHAAWSAQLVLGVDPTRPFRPHDDRSVNFGLHRNNDLGIAHDVIIDVPKVKRRRDKVQNQSVPDIGHWPDTEQAKMASGLLGYVGLSQNMDNSSPGPYH